MKYAAARDKIRSGDLLAWSHRGWSTWHDIKIQLVRFFSQSEYSHVGTAYVGQGRVFVLEAVQPLVRQFPLSKLLPFYWLPMNALWRPETEEFAFEKIGEPYSQHEAVLAFLGRLKPGSSKLWECAEYSGAIAKADGIDLGARAVPTDVVQAAMRRAGVVLNYVEAD